MTDATKMAIEALGGLIESVTGVDQVSAVNQARTALAALRAQPDHSELVTAARAVVERWETPLWKDAPATAGYINRLRDALPSIGETME